MASQLRQRAPNASAAKPSDSSSSLNTIAPSSEPSAHDSNTLSAGKEASAEDIVWGKTPSGVVFRVPTTYDVLTALFHPTRPKSHLDLLSLTLLSLQVILFFVLPRHVAQRFFLVYFAFWRFAYDGGLGFVLGKQSRKRWIVREVERRGWLDENKRPKVYAWIRDQLKYKMGSDYSFDDLPVEYNTWLLFRQAVDIILTNDFLAYTLFAFSSFRIPENLSPWMHFLRWAGGVILIVFNIWVKKEAHHVVKDYGWYWGDVFFQRGALVFDGVFEMAPHPMYSVGYAGYYGLSLIVGSYPVLFASLATHAAQFAFLIYFENPHIERTYGQRKLMSMRTPVDTSYAVSETIISPLTDDVEAASPLATLPSSHRQQVIHYQASDSFDESTPSATEGETATSEADVSTEEGYEAGSDIDIDDGFGSSSKTGLITQRDSTSSVGRKSPRRSPTILASDSPRPAFTLRKRAQSFSQHDLLTRYFRKDPIGFRNLDLFRTSDIKLVLLVMYGLVCAFLPPLSHVGTLVLYTAHALFWRFFHSFGLGLVLRAQSERKFLVRHYMKNYHYSATNSEDIKRGALEEAFTNWKGAYNMSLCMTYVSFISLAWKTYTVPQTWTVGVDLLRHILGAMLIGLHFWTSMQSYEVLGVFGWFFGDFFIEDYPATLDYTGIYRYLNNPERTMSGAALFGLALISGSKVVFAIALVSHLSHWWFLSNVEGPHMRKVYGPSLRKEAGLTRNIKRMALKNTELQRVAQEVKGTFEKVYEETAEVVEDFLNKSRPRLSGVVQETKVLLQQSREKLVITRVAQDMSSYDPTQYALTFATNVYPVNQLRFHVGEPIRLTWNAPKNHSRRDWVGMYRVGANKSTLVTKTSSLGMWVPVHDEDWDGDLPLPSDGKAPQTDHGVLEFSGDKLPWQVGMYELRYHHDGKYNVMTMVGPIEIYVAKPASYTFSDVRSCLMGIIPYCLDSDPSLVPVSSKEGADSPSVGSSSSVSSELEPSPSDDDFRFWSEAQAKRIAGCIKAAFDVEYAHNVILADANVSTLAKRILVAKELS